ncbi:MAG: GntR family transcriptional regulator, partial [Rhodobacteraceae bacterium]|nr:GntR family transcriptional regulator [Paracoccaceae bacterium]
MNANAPSGPEALVRDVLQGLAEGRFVPGQRLAEPDLMSRYGLGRSTVREGLGRLAASGIVVQTPHRGAQIRLLGRRAACDVLRVTEPLLGLAARQAAEAVARGGDPAPLRLAAAEYDAAGFAEKARARARYYRALTLLAGNAELDRLLPMLQ